MKRIITCSLITISCISFSAADWSQFRGPGGNPAAADAEIPATFGADENVEWIVPVAGRSASSPIIVGEQLILTSDDGAKQDRLLLQSYSTDSGDLLWTRNFWATGRPYTHPASSNAAPSPVSDGRFIVAFYSSNDLVCTDMDGNLQWFRGLGHDYPKTGNDIGMAASPIIAGDVVIAQLENQGDSYAVGVDIKTGEELWHVERDPRANWSSPVVRKRQDGKYTVILSSPGTGIRALDSTTGNELWSYKANCGSNTSPLIVDDVLYISANGTTALQLNPAGTTPKVLWEANRLGQNAASPVVHDDKIYVLSGPIIKCADATNGDLLWQVRLNGRFWATPILTKDRMFLINQDGQVHVISLGDKGELAGDFSIDQVVMGTPAVSGDAMFIRTHGSLWKVTSK